MKLIIDWYFWAAVGMSLATAASVGVQTFILGVIVIVKVTQRRKEEPGEGEKVKRKGE